MKYGKKHRQYQDIPVKKLKENAEYFAEYICFDLTK